MFVGMYLVIAALLEICCLIKLLTKFTDEIFSALVSFIFIFEALKNTYNVFANPASSTSVILLSIGLVTGTYYCTMSLKDLRRSPYLSPAMRNLLGDMASPIAIVLLTLVDMYFRTVKGNTR